MVSLEITFFTVQEVYCLYLAFSSKKSLKSINNYHFDDFINKIITDIFIYFEFLQITTITIMINCRTWELIKREIWAFSD